MQWGKPPCGITLTKWISSELRMLLMVGLLLFFFFYDRSNVYSPVYALRWKISATGKKKKQWFKTVWKKRKYPNKSLVILDNRILHHLLSAKIKVKTLCLLSKLCDLTGMFNSGFHHYYLFGNGNTFLSCNCL